MSVHSLSTPHAADAARLARIHLAAAYRMATLHDLDEGIDNHFTVAVPGQPNRYLILPFGTHWSFARASDMVEFDETGRTLSGDGIVELSAQCIHAPIHRITGARVVLHTHQPWAVALNMLQNNRLVPASQTGLFFHNRIAYDDDYTGLAHGIAEGERLAALLGDKQVMFMKNHGVLVAGDTVAQAYRNLYRIERACRTQLLAMGSGQVIQTVSEEVIARVQQPNPEDRHPRAERERLFFEAMMRVLDRELPGYAD